MSLLGVTTPLFAIPSIISVSSNSMHLIPPALIRTLSCFFCFFVVVMMMMIAFITTNSGLVPKMKVYALKSYILDVRLSVVNVHIFCFSFSEGKMYSRKKAGSPRSHPAS